jgi:hypothetical protein
MRHDLRKPGLLAALLASAAFSALLAGPAAAGDPGTCPADLTGLKCSTANNIKTPGGGAKAPHNDGAGHSWPRINGMFWQALDARSRQQLGGPDNDELLGHHGDDKLSGAGGNDVIWGDWDPKHNTTHQHDIISGGSGNDWLYPSHGAVTVKGGPGRDYVYAYYGHGTIDCGPGNDTARVRLGTGQYKLHGCEHVLHFCAFGDNGHGGCFKPGENPKGRRAR